MDRIIRFMQEQHRLFGFNCIPIRFDSHCFRVEFPRELQNNSLGVHEISCAVPSDCNRQLTFAVMTGRSPQYIEYETALVSSSYLC